MIDITFIRENPERFERIMKSRNVEFFSDDILNLDKEKRYKINKLQVLQSERNSISRLIGINKSKKLDTKELEKKVSVIKKNMLYLEQDINLLTVKLNEILLNIPNIPDKDVPIGKDDSSNKILFTSNKIIEGAELSNPLLLNENWNINKSIDLDDDSLIIALKKDLCLQES